MNWKPFIKFREETIFKAFLLSSLVLGLQLGFTMYFQRGLDKYEDNNLHGLSELQKAIIVILATILFSFISFVILRVLFGWGQGLLIGGKVTNKFW